MGKTKVDGTVIINIPVNEQGTVRNGVNEPTNYNEHVFFVIEGGKVKPVIVDVNALKLSKTLKY